MVSGAVARCARGSTWSRTARSWWRRGPPVAGWPATGSPGGGPPRCVGRGGCIPCGRV